MIYLKETYNLIKNDQTIDKIIDRGKLKRERRITKKLTLIRVDSLLANMNNYKFNSLETNNNEIDVFLLDIENLFNAELQSLLKMFK